MNQPIRFAVCSGAFLVLPLLGIGCTPKSPARKAPEQAPASQTATPAPSATDDAKPVPAPKADTTAGSEKSQNAPTQVMADEAAPSGAEPHEAASPASGSPPSVVSSGQPAEAAEASAAPGAPADPELQFDLTQLEKREEYWPGGEIKRVWYVERNAEGQEVEHGPSISRHQNGVKFLDGAYVHGVRHGTWLSWYPDEQMRGSGHFDHGEKTGEWSRWNEKGVLRSRVHYSHDVPNGPSSVWDENGNLLERGEYFNGLKHGSWITVSPDGTETQTLWNNGVVVP